MPDVGGPLSATLSPGLTVIGNHERRYDPLSRSQSLAAEALPQAYAVRSLSVQNIAVLFLLTAFLVLPHGIGFDHPFGLPSLDLPRLSALLLNLVALSIFIHRIRNAKKLFLPAPQVQVCLVLIGAWQVLAALASATPKGSLIWALGNWVMLWGLAFSVNAMSQFDGFSEQLIKMLKAVAIILALWAWGEWVTQDRVVTFRNTFPPHVLANSLELNRMYRLSIGPYPCNHYLGILLCTLGGFLLMDRRRLLLGSLLIGGVLSTGFVAGFVGFAIMLVLFGGLSRSWLAVIFLSVLLACTVTAITLGQPTGLQLPLEAPYAYLLAGSDNMSSPIMRIRNNEHMLHQALAHPILGFGPGAVGDPARVPSALEFWTDTGGIIVHIVESGYIVGVVMIFILCMSIWKGIRSRDSISQGGALGLIGFAFTQLSTPIAFFWGIAFIICGLIEYRARLAVRSDPRDVSANGVLK